MIHVVLIWHGMITYADALSVKDKSHCIRGCAKSYCVHYIDVIMTTMASQITSLTVVYSTVYSDADQRKHQSTRHWPLCGEFTGTGEFPHKGPVTRKMFPFDDVIMFTLPLPWLQGYFRLCNWLSLRWCGPLINHLPLYVGPFLANLF